MKNTQRGFIPLIIIAIIVAASIGGGIYVAKKHKAAQKHAEELSVQGDIEASTTSSANGKVDSEGRNAGTLRGLFSLATPSMCTFSGTNSTGSVTGTVYVAGPMMRGDTTMTTSAKGTMESHMIRNNGDMYVWSGTQGAKMSMGDFESNSSSHAGAQAQAKTNVDLDQQVSYSCTAWTKDDSKFVVPTTVTFVDLNAMMKNMPIKGGVKGGIQGNIGY